MAARDPRSYDLADFRTLGDRPYPPILLEAMERAGDRFVRWDEQVAHTGYCYRPVRLRGRVWQVDRRSRESAEEIGRLDASPHVRRLVAAAWTLGLVEHAHGLGFGGHFPTGVDSRMTIHGLRHSAVSILLQARGAPEDDSGSARPRLHQDNHGPLRTPCTRAWMRLRRKP